MSEYMNMARDHVHNWEASQDLEDFINTHENEIESHVASVIEQSIESLQQQLEKKHEEFLQQNQIGLDLHAQLKASEAARLELHNRLTRLCDSVERDCCLSEGMGCRQIVLQLEVSRELLAKHSQEGGN